MQSGTQASCVAYVSSGLCASMQAGTSVVKRERASGVLQVNDGLEK